MSKMQVKLQTKKKNIFKSPNPNTPSCTFARLHCIRVHTSSVRDKNKDNAKSSIHTRLTGTERFVIQQSAYLKRRRWNIPYLELQDTNLCCYH